MRRPRTSADQPWIETLLQARWGGTKMVVHNEIIDLSMLPAWVADPQRGLATTNDNIAALRFYQRRGFTLQSLRLGAVSAARARKPEIPLIGHNNIPIRDEIDLCLTLD